MITSQPPYMPEEPSSLPLVSHPDFQMYELMLCDFIRGLESTKSPESPRLVKMATETMAFAALAQYIKEGKKF